MSTDVEVYETPIEQLQVSSPADAVAVRSASEGAMLESMFLMSQRVPRNVSKAIDNAIALATLDKETAEKCFYAFKRGGKMIVGPSIRMAEILQQCWGRMFVTTRQVAVTRKVVIVEGRAIDLASLACVATEVSRKITTSSGETFNEDMITVTGNAAQSIARRNAIFALVPVPLRKKVEDAVRKCAHGDVKSHSERRTVAFAKVGKLGVSQDRILAVLDKASFDEVTPEDLLILASLYEQITEEGKDPDALFPDPNAKPVEKPGPTSAAPGGVSASDLPGAQPAASATNAPESEAAARDIPPARSEPAKTPAQPAKVTPISAAAKPAEGRSL